MGSAPEQELRAQVCRMADQLVHRGPDDSGLWVDAEAGVALGFRRLAIVDLSPAGHQPMTSSNGRYVIVFNGEVYNFGELRKDLEPLGHGFRGHSDTEVMLEAVSEWGLEAAVKEIRRHVRLRSLGQARASAAPGAGSAGHKTTLLRLAG